MIDLLVWLDYWNEFVMDLFEAHNQIDLLSYMQLSNICILAKGLFYCSTLFIWPFLAL
jgi:hypothetical protein